MIQNALLFAFLTISLLLFGQVVTTMPITFTGDDTITLQFDATQGDQGLQGFTGDVYMHTGVITTNSANPGDWKYVKAGWGSADTSVLMTWIGTDLYEKRIHVRSYYGIPPGDTVLQLAFVFRNASGSQSGRAANGSDIFIPLSGQGFSAYVDAQWDGQTLRVNYGPSAVFLTPFNDAMYRVSYALDTANYNDTSYAVVMTPESVNAQYTHADSMLYLSWGHYELTVITDPFRIITRFQGDTLVEEKARYYGINQSVQGIRFVIDTSAYWQGGGSRAIEVDRTGRSLLFYNEQKGGYGWGADPMNTTIPLLISSDGLGIFMDNHHRSTAQVGTYAPHILDWQIEGGTLQYFVVAGEGQYDKVLEEYSALTGRQPLPPRWALGFIQSRYGYTSEQHARNIVATMKAQNFPLDVLILDLYWFDKMGDLDWNRSQWPTAEQMIIDFRQQGVKTVNITEPYFLQTSVNYQFLANNGYFGTTPQGTPYVLNSFWQGPAGLLDIYQKDAQDWMWAFYKDRMNEGVAGWWCDLGEPELHPTDMNHSLGDAQDVHNLYSLIWAEMLHRNYQKDFPNKRLFNLIRSGWAGMQRYGTFPWSGDVQRSWDGLQAQIPIMLGMSMSGHGYMHGDLGGFVGGSQDGELYTRWLQMGAFVPIMRAHGLGVPTEPIFYAEPYKSIVHEYINLRYRLLPYNYSLAWQNTLTGAPLAKPMDYFEPSNPSLRNLNDQYFWGDDFIVAPVQDAGATGRSVVLPSRKWFNWHTDAIISGNQTVNVNAPLDQLPLFVRAGAFIPLAMPMQHTEEYRIDSLEVHYYHDASIAGNTFTLYEDDGEDPAAIASNYYVETIFTSDFDGKRLAINIDTNGMGFADLPTTRYFVLTIHNWGTKPEQVTWNGFSLPQVTGQGGLNAQDSAYYWDAQQHQCWVKVPFRHQPSVLEIDGESVGTERPQLVSSPSNTLHAPFPNPASSTVALPFTIDQPGTYHLSISDLAGRPIWNKEVVIHQTGVYQETVDGSDLKLTAGIYVVRLHGVDFHASRKLFWQQDRLITG